MSRVKILVVPAPSWLERPDLYVAYVFIDDQVVTHLVTFSPDREALPRYIELQEVETHADEHLERARARLPLVDIRFENGEHVTNCLLTINGTAQEVAVGLTEEAALANLQEMDDGVWMRS